MATRHTQVQFTNELIELSHITEEMLIKELAMELIKDLSLSDLLKIFKLEKYYFNERNIPLYLEEKYRMLRSRQVNEFKLTIDI